MYTSERYVGVISILYSYLKTSTYTGSSEESVCAGGLAGYVTASFVISDYYSKGSVGEGGSNGSSFIGYKSDGIEITVKNTPTTSHGESTSAFTYPYDSTLGSADEKSPTSYLATYPYRIVAELAGKSKTDKTSTIHVGDWPSVETSTSQDTG